MTKHADLVTVTTFNSEMDAQVAKGHLASEGIKAYLVNDDSGGMWPNFQMTAGVTLLVRERDEEKARTILHAVKTQ